jgi:selT/selW/selH-like putative selenoprotein
LAAKIKQVTGLESSTRPGQSGQFDVSVDGKLIYSRFETGEFPEEEDIIKSLTGK